MQKMADGLLNDDDDDDDRSFPSPSLLPMYCRRHRNADISRASSCSLLLGGTTGINRNVYSGSPAVLAGCVRGLLATKTKAYNF